MNQESTNKYWQELEALKAGKVIQKRVKYDTAGEFSEWFDDSDPSFMINPLNEFRAKPEPREWWIISGYSPVMLFPTKASARVYAQRKFGGMFKLVHVIEKL